MSPTFVTIKSKSLRYFFESNLKKATNHGQICLLKVLEEPTQRKPCRKVVLQQHRKLSSDLEDHKSSSYGDNILKDDSSQTSDSNKQQVASKLKKRLKKKPKSASHQQEQSPEQTSDPKLNSRNTQQHHDQSCLNFSNHLRNVPLLKHYKHFKASNVAAQSQLQLTASNQINSPHRTVAGNAKKLLKNANAFALINAKNFIKTNAISMVKYFSFRWPEKTA